MLPAGASAGRDHVRRDAGLNAQDRAEMRADAGVTFERNLPLAHVELVSAPDARADQALAALNADPDVRFAVPDIAVHATAAPADPGFAQQWAFDSGTNPDIDLPEAWLQAPQSGANVTVAVADQLISINHPDLNDNIDQRYRDNKAAYDFTEPDGCTAGTPLANRDHGTHVAGIVAAERDNGIGGTGIAPAAKILPLRTLDNCGAGQLSWVLEAFNAAGTAAIPIVVASFATDPLMDPQYRAAFNSLLASVFANHENTLYVVAAGNKGNDNDTVPVYPCSTVGANGQHPVNLVCVGLTKRDDAPVCWGNTGRRSVDLLAPGTEIYSTVGPSIYVMLGGTSEAAPMAAGTAALLKSKETSYTADQLRNQLLRGVDAYAAWRR